MTSSSVRCPGPGGRGCGAVLELRASYCYACERMFTGHELYEAWLDQEGEALADRPA